MTKPKLSETLSVLGEIVSSCQYYGFRATRLADAIALLEQVGIMKDGKFINQWGANLERLDGGDECKSSE